MSRLARLCGWLMGRRYRLALIVLGLALASPSLFIGLQTDDLMLRGAALRLSPAEGVRRGPWEPFTFLNGDPAACSHMLWMTTRMKEGRPLPARCLNLGPSSAPLAITRTDERTLVVRPAAGYLLPLGGSPDPGRPPDAFSFAHMIRFFDILFRGPDHPMRLGERVELTVVTVEITALTPDGRPAEAAFRFRVPLEHPSLRWFACRRGGFVPFAPPAVGQTVSLPSALE